MEYAPINDFLAKEKVKLKEEISLNPKKEEINLEKIAPQKYFNNMMSSL